MRAVPFENLNIWNFAKCTQTELKWSDTNSILHMKILGPVVPNFHPFCSTASPFQDIVASRWCVRAVVASRRSCRAFTGCLGGFVSSAHRPVFDGVSRSPVRYSLDCLSRAPRLSLLLILLRRWVRSTAGAAILYLLPCPDGLPSISLSVCRLSHRHSPNKNPAFLC